MTKTNYLLTAIIYFSLMLLIVAGEPKGSLSGFAKLRQWSDKTGKTRIDASLTFADNQEVQLKREDGKRMKIQLSKLSDADQAFIKAFLTAESALNGAPASESPFENVEESEMKSGAKADVAVGKTEMEATVPVKKFSDRKTANIAVDYRQPFWKGTTVSALRVPVGEDMTFKAPVPKDFHDAVEMMVAGATPMAYVGLFREGRGGTPFSQLGMMDFSKADPISLGEFTVPWRLLAVTPDASRIAMVRVEGWGTGNDLVIASVANGKMKPDFQFRAGGGSWDELAWVSFINNDRLATITKKHVLTIWDFKENRISHRGPCGDALSAAIGGRGEMLAMPKEGRVAVLSGTNFKQVGLFELNRAKVPTIAFSPDGKRLAAYTPFSIDIFRLEDGQLDKTIVVAQDRPGLALSWIGDYLLLDNQLLVDCQRGMPLWTYNCHNTARAVWAGQLFTLFPGEKGTIVASKLPHPAAERAAETIPPEKLYALRKGSEIELTTKLQGLDPIQESAAAQAVRRNLHSLGYKLVDQSDNQVHLELQQANEQESEYGTSNSPFPSPFSRPSGPLEKVRYRPWIHTIVVSIKGEETFRTQQSVSSPWSMNTREGESAQQAVDRHVRPSVDFFRNVTLPAEILRPEYRHGLGKSEITPNGIQ
jgi:SLA1 homology domain 1, SHD1